MKLRIKEALKIIKQKDEEKLRKKKNETAKKWMRDHRDERNEKRRKIRIGGSLKENQQFIGRVKVSFCVVCGKELKRNETTCGMRACSQAWVSRNRPTMKHMKLEQKRDWYSRTSKDYLPSVHVSV